MTARKGEEADGDLISIRTPRVGGDSCMPASNRTSLFQFAPPRGGDHGHLLNRRMVVISIHTPAWGVTLAYWFEGCVNLFQFAPRVGGEPEAHRFPSTS